MTAMILTYDQIRPVARGIVRIEQSPDGISLHRFTKEQEEFYRTQNEDFYRKAFATAGVVLEFDTDSRSLGLRVNVTAASSRNYYVHSIFANGRRIGEISGEFAENGKPQEAGGNFRLAEGMKRIRIEFPWLAASRIKELSLDDGAKLIPVKKEKKILLYGDSITQGYDASRPEIAYGARIITALDADGIVKAIGGEIFCGELGALKDDFAPNLITVAYGTNDWSNRDRASFEQSCSEFLQNLRRNYPETKMTVLGPIWRADIGEERPLGKFTEVGEYIRHVAQKLGNAEYIDCMDFVPHDPGFYSDRYLHPNDAGFEMYSDNLIRVLI